MRAPGRESGFVFFFVSLPFPFSLPFAPHPALFFSFSRNYSGTRGPSLDCTVVPEYPAYVVTGTRVRPCTRPFCSPSCIVEAWAHDPLSRILQVIKPALKGITTLSQGYFSCDSQNEVVEGVNLVLGGLVCLVTRLITRSPPIPHFASEARLSNAV